VLDNKIQLRQLVHVDKANYWYLIVNICLSAFSFLRSFVFMRTLDLTELGVISLIQTIFMFMGLLQCGLLNGGYRIISLGKAGELEKTNNTVFSYVAILTPIGIIFCLLSAVFGWIKDLSLILLLISVLFGLFTLIDNWFHNVLIGERKLADLNIINIISYTASFIALPLAFVFGLWGAVLVIALPPSVFVGSCLVKYPELRPSAFFFNKHYLKYILSFGFIPFLGGIFSMIYTQVERWSVVGQLGIDALGAFYLVFLYVSLFNLVPNSLNSIFFPRGVKSYANNDFSYFKRLLKYYYLCQVGYGVVICVVTILLLQPIVALVFPNHLPGVEFVYLVLPGLVLNLLIAPLGLLLNSAVILKPMLYVNAIGLLLNVVGIMVMITNGFFTLSNVAILRSLSGAWFLAGYIIAIIMIRKRLFVPAYVKQR